MYLQAQLFKIHHVNYIIVPKCYLSEMHNHYSLDGIDENIYMFKLAVACLMENVAGDRESFCFVVFVFVLRFN